MTEAIELRTLGPSRTSEAVAVLCDAFVDYPVMRYLVGPVDQAYPERLRALLDFFVTARLLKDGLVLTIEPERGSLAAVALVTLPGERSSPRALVQRRELLWQSLGDVARARYESCGEVWRRFSLDQPHYHLNLLGVRRAHAGRGLARRLLADVHRRSADDPGSVGVTLTTEDPANVPLYQRFGYRIVGEAVLAPGIQTCSFFRADTQ